MPIITVQKLNDADRDADSLDDFISGNGKKEVTTRRGKKYKTAPEVEQTLLDNGLQRGFPDLATLQAHRPAVLGTLAKDMSTRKIWMWNGSVWVDTGKSDLELANAFSEEIVALAILSLKKKLKQVFGFDNNISLLNIVDDNDNIVFSFTRDGEIITAKSGNIDRKIEEILKLVDLKIDNFEKFLNIDNQDALLNILDANENIVISFTRDGDIVTAKSGSISEKLNKVDAVSDGLESNLTKCLFQLSDAGENIVATVTIGGDIVTAKSGSIDENLKSSAKPLWFSQVSNHERLTASAVAVFNQYQHFNKSDISVPFGLLPSPYSLNVDDLFGRKISITEPNLKFSGFYFAEDAEVVHPFLCMSHRKFNGFNYLVLANPYTLARDLFEDPCVYVSNDNIDYSILEYSKSPLDRTDRISATKYNYNSDNFYAYDHRDGAHIIAWRHGGADGIFDLRYVKTYNFVDYSQIQTMYLGTGELMLSPNILYDFENQRWCLYSVSGDKDNVYKGNRFNVRFAQDLNNTWGDPVYFDTPFQSWHQETRYFGKDLVAIINDNSANLFLAVSQDNGTTWRYSDGLLQTPQSYKGSISPYFKDGKLNARVMFTGGTKAPVNKQWKGFSADLENILYTGV